jgi:hypothetical protein
MASSPMASSPKAPFRAPLIFRIEERDSIFHVTLDGRFFGDYRSRRWAMDGVAQEARLAAATGASARAINVSRAGAIISDESLGPF